MCCFDEELTVSFQRKKQNPGVFCLYQQDLHDVSQGVESHKQDLMLTSVHPKPSGEEEGGAQREGEKITAFYLSQ